MKKTNLILKVLLMAFVLSTQGFSQQADNWQWLNPKPQGNTLNAMDFVNGVSWNNLNAGVSAQLYSVDFADLNTGYIGGVNQMFRKTTDGGIT